MKQSSIQIIHSCIIPVVRNWKCCNLLAKKKENSLYLIYFSFPQFVLLNYKAEYSVQIYELLLLLSIEL